MELYLNSTFDKETLLEAVDDIRYMTGGTSTYLALDALVDISFQVRRHFIDSLKVLSMQMKVTGYLSSLC